VHHCDLDLDVSSGIRFHPIEILISIGVKMVSVFIIGPDPVAVILFEVLLNASAQFNHGNLKIPESIEKYLRLFIVTPDFHITHHSVEPKETNSNYGFMLTWWDYLFKSYIRCPGAGYEEMTIGLKQYRDIKKLKIVNLLLMPFK